MEEEAEAEEEAEEAEGQAGAQAGRQAEENLLVKEGFLLSSAYHCVSWQRREQKWMANVPGAVHSADPARYRIRCCRCPTELHAAKQVDEWVADALRRQLISREKALQLRNFPERHGDPVWPRSRVWCVSYEPGENRSAAWRARSKKYGFDGRYYTQQEAEQAALAALALAKEAAALHRQWPSSEGSSSRRGVTRPPQLELSVQQQVALLHELQPEVDAVLDLASRRAVLQRLREVKFRQAADEELLLKEAAFKHGYDVASLMRRLASYLRRHDLNSSLRAGVLRLPTPPPLHLLHGLDWHQGVAFLQSHGGPLARFPGCHLDHQGPMAHKDGSAPAMETTSLAHLMPCQP